MPWYPYDYSATNNDYFEIQPVSDIRFDDAGNEFGFDTYHVGIVLRSPSWIYRMVDAAHDGEQIGRSRWRKLMCSLIADRFNDCNIYPGDDTDDAMRHHIVDYLHAYFSEEQMLEWVSEIPARKQYALDYFAEFGDPYVNSDTGYHDDPLAPIKVAMYQCIRVMVDIMADFYEDNGDD